MYDNRTNKLKALELSHLVKMTSILSQAVNHKNPIKALNSRFWSATWTKDSRGFYFAAKHLGIEYRKFAAFKIWLISFLQSYLGKDPRIHFPRNRDLANIKNIYVSWTFEADWEKIKEDVDRYYGIVPKSEDALHCCWLMGRPSQGFKEFLLKNGYAFIEKQWHLDRINSLLKAFSISFKEEGLWGALKTLFTISGDIVSGISIAGQMARDLKSSLDLKNIVFTYEAQPIQNTWIFFLKAAFPKLRVFGYIHSSMCTFPSYFYKRIGSPDYLLVHGSAYKRVLKDYLGWELSEIRVIPTLRFKRKKKEEFSGKIYLPYEFVQPDLICQEVENIIKSIGKGRKKPIPRLHPAKTMTPDHIALRSRIEEIIGKYEPIFSDSGDEITVVVSLSTALLEAIENGIEVIQIAVEPNIDAYSAEIWPELEEFVISQYSFGYRLKIPSAFVFYGDTETNPTLPQIIEAI